MSDIIININEQPNLGEQKMLNSIATRPVAAYQSVGSTTVVANNYGLVSDCVFTQSLSTDIEGAVEQALGIQKAGKAAWQLAPGNPAVYLDITILALWQSREEVNVKSIGLCPLLDGSIGAQLGACDSAAVIYNTNATLSANFKVLLQQGYQTNAFSIVATAQNPAQTLDQYTILITTV